MKRLFILFFSLSILTACAQKTAKQAQKGALTSVSLVDRNGFSETLSSSERLRRLEKADFLAPQPYQKVLRTFERNKKGEVPSVITSYHANGQIREYLDVVSSRAHGTYREWYSNGVQKVEARVISGAADLEPEAQKTWLFDGMTRAWFESGEIEAEIPYEKGKLEGEAIHYHSSGDVWKRTPHKNGLIDGKVKVFNGDGSLLMESDYFAGKRHGKSERFWPANKQAFQERYSGGLLTSGTYWNKQGAIVGKIEGGNGFRAVFGRSEVESLQEFRNGRQEGIVKLLRENGTTSRYHHTKGSAKHGAEVIFYPNSDQRKLEMSWSNGAVHGIAKTWYPNGAMRSQREMSQNKRQGLSSAWYPDGSLMLLEEYEGDRLVRAEYRKKGERPPVSRVLGGEGTATLFDEHGHVLRRIKYEGGLPVE